MCHLNYVRLVNASEIAISFRLVLFHANTNKNSSQTRSGTHRSLKIAASLNWLILDGHIAVT